MSAFNEINLFDRDLAPLWTVVCNGKKRVTEPVHHPKVTSTLVICIPNPAAKE
jgi:hypothetical protein